MMVEPDLIDRLNANAIVLRSKPLMDAFADDFDTAKAEIERQASLIAELVEVANTARVFAAKYKSTVGAKHTLAKIDAALNLASGGK